MAPCSAPTLPKRFLHYEFVKRLGGGGAGEVGQYRDPVLGRLVAIKFPYAPSGHDGGHTFRQFRLLQDEAKKVAACRSAWVCMVHACPQDGELPGIVMECADGSLADMLRYGPLSLSRALPLAMDILRGLWDCHTAQAGAFIHRDLKPANVLLFAEGEEAKLTDFSHSVRIETPGDEASAVGAGTPRYFAPEQTPGTLWYASVVNESTDLWGVGVLLFEMLTGSLPYKLEGGYPLHSTTPDVLAHYRESTKSQNLPEDLLILLGKLLAADPQHRPTSANECLISVKRLLRGENERSVHFEASALLDVLVLPKAGLPSQGRPQKLFRDLSDRTFLHSSAVLLELMEQYPLLIFRAVVTGGYQRPAVGFESGSWDAVLQWIAKWEERERSKSREGQKSREGLKWIDLADNDREDFIRLVWSRCASPVENLIQDVGKGTPPDALAVLRNYRQLLATSILPHRAAFLLSETLAGDVGTLVTARTEFFEDPEHRRVLGQYPRLNVVPTRATSTSPTISPDQETPTAM